MEQIQIPVDALRIILSFLLDDAASICHFEETCQLHRQTLQDYPELFEQMLERRYTRSLDRHFAEARLEFQRRRQLDKTAAKCIRGMARDLRRELGETAVSMNDFSRIGGPWDHSNWKVLLQLRSNIHDLLKSMANASIDYSKELLEQNIQRFFAARALVSIHILECLHEWKDITMTEPPDNASNNIRDLVLERYALLAVKAQMTPTELLSETRPIELIVNETLDRIAEDCRERVEAVSHTAEKLGILNQVLFHEMNFSGNDRDYYNYKNSLLNHVLISKKGIPITLAIIYKCVARRLSLHVDFIGLPGHLVLAFQDDLEGKQRFLDVFRGGVILELSECQQIASSYGFSWHASFAEPLDPYQVFTRILNNLSNCHGQAPILSDPPLFRQTLSFQERLLMLVHRQPRIAVSLLERFSQDLPMTMSVEMLKLYGLVQDNEGSLS